MAAVWWGEGMDLAAALNVLSCDPLMDIVRSARFGAAICDDAGAGVSAARSAPWLHALTIEAPMNAKPAQAIAATRADAAWKRLAKRAEFRLGGKAGM
jgi:hypothetical protein